MSTPASQTLSAVVRLLDEGRPDLAEAAAAELRARAPRDPKPVRLQGIALLQLGRVDAARRAFEDGLTLAPDSVLLLSNLASALLAQGEVDAAVARLEQARALLPNHPAVLNGLGNARRAQGDLAGAAEAYAEATRAAPEHVGAWLNLAAATLAQGDVTSASRQVRRALAREPGNPEGLLLRGHVLAAQQLCAEAEAVYREGAERAPDDPRFPYQCGLMAEEQKHPSEAAEAYAQALTLDPDFDQALGQLVFLRRQLCDWRALDPLSRRLRERVAAGSGGISPFGFLAEPACAAEQLLCAQNFAQSIESAAAPQRARLQWRHPQPAADAPLRVGFASNGFGEHPTGLLTVALFEALRETPLEIHLFATAADDGGPISRRLHAAANVWHDLGGLAALPAAERIHRAEVEILIDLRGWGGGGIAAALALRPAPVQVGWLAYPGTSGAPWIDYCVADRIVLPESLRTAFSEKVAWLPRCFQPCDISRALAAPPPREALGLPESGVVYACFNNAYKLNPPSFARMLTVLGEVSDSVLWLLMGPAGADQRLREAAERRGIDPTRLVFAEKRAHAEYLALYRHVDLFLDTAPYGAHTTASDALYAGCPVLSLPGETFASRVAASLNEHLGLAEMNAADEATFVAEAVRLGRDPEALAALRAKLAARRDASGVFDMRGFAGDFSALLQRMSARHRAGLPPAPLE